MNVAIRVRASVNLAATELFGSGKSFMSTVTLQPIPSVWDNPAGAGAIPRIAIF